MLPQASKVGFMNRAKNKPQIDSKKPAYIRLVSILLITLIFILRIYWFGFGATAKVMSIAIFVMLGIFLISNLLSIKKYQEFTQEKKIQKLLFVWGVVFSSSLLLYFVAYEWRMLPKQGFLASIILPTTILIAFIVSLVSGLMLEVFNLTRGRGRFADYWRAMQVLKRSLLMSSLLVVVVMVNLFFSQKNQVFDLSYLKIAQPSAATIQAVKKSQEGLSIAVFFEQENKVKPYIQKYFNLIKQEVATLDVVYLDKGTNNSTNTIFKAGSDGKIGLAFNGNTRYLNMGTNLRFARKTLKRLDAMFYRRLNELTTDTKVAYFTQGHGEIDFNQINQTPQKSLRAAEKIFQQLNFELKKFGTAEGSSTAVPEDARLVLVTRPQNAFTQAEVEVLRQYIGRGGSLLISLSPLSKPEVFKSLSGLLADLKVSYQPDVVAHETKYMNGLGRSPESKWFIYSNLYHSHDAVASLSTHGENIPFVMLRSGIFGYQKSPNLKTLTLLRSIDGSFIDLNKNFRYDGQQESKNHRKQKGTYHNLILSVEEVTSHSKIILHGSGLWISDLLMQNQANQVMLSDHLRWFSSLEESPSMVSSEEDVPIILTGSVKAWVVNFSLFIAPFMVLLAGFVATRP